MASARKPQISACNIETRSLVTDGTYSSIKMVMSPESIPDAAVVVEDAIAESAEPQAESVSCTPMVVASASNIEKTCVFKRTSSVLSSSIEVSGVEPDESGRPGCGFSVETAIAGPESGFWRSDSCC